MGLMSFKILVVGAAEADYQIIEDAMNKCCLLTAADDHEAICQIDMHPDINLIILDLSTPDLDGFQFLATLNSDDRYKKMRTILLTNGDELENEAKGLKLGAADAIRKPLRGESFQSIIKLHLQLLEQQAFIKTIFKQAPIGIAISYGTESSTTDTNEVISINVVFEQIIGRTKEELLELGWAKITHPDDLEEDQRNYHRLLSGEINNYSMEKRYIKPDGSIVWVDMVVASLNVANDDNIRSICLTQDITKRKKMEHDLIESERSKSVLLSHIPGMAYRCNYDREWTMQFVSAGCFALTGYAPENLLYNRDLTYNDLIVPEYREPIWEEWARTLAKRQPFKYEYEITTAQGERKWVWEMGEGVFNDQGEVEALEGIVLDISERKEMENHLRHHYEHDIWTGLPNRRYLEKLLKHDVELWPWQKRALVGINLSTVNALTMTYGFHYTQEVIKQIANALQSHCNDNCGLYHTYEYRFVYYIRSYNGQDELAAFCKAVANTIESLLAAERIGAGIGVIEMDQHNKHDVDQLLKNLLIASEKALGNDDQDFGFCFFNQAMETEILREEEITRELAQIAVNEHDERLFLLFQPIVDLQANQICGFEALARLDSNKLGLIPPLEFIPIAEKTKLIIPLGKKIILQAFNFLNKLKENGYDSVGVSINISAIQLLRDDFTQYLLEMINERRVDPANIGLEVTESVFASNYQEINSILGELKSLGIKIAIDDFGTGYSSLARERELNLNCLKIDKYFIDKLLLLKDEEAITSDIIAMAHKLGHDVIAEGVEYERQRQYLLKYGCDRIQGYLISKPLTEAAALDLLRNYPII
jgi:PAS domain S-box-containing protein